MSILAKANAKKLLKDLFLDEPGKIDLYAIAGCENIFIEERDLSACEGELVFKDSIGIISVDRKLVEQGQKKFTIAHELGHYFNSGKKNGSYFCSGLDIRGIKQSISAEVDANDFAAELLMPEEWFRSFTKGKRFEKKILSDIAEYFGVSLSAAAMRYAEAGSHPVAIIMSKDGVVKWSRINNYFPFKFIRTGSSVSSSSYAYEFYKGEKISDEVETILADAWFQEDFNYKKDYFLFEQNIPMYRYNAVLTVLWEK
ncbi:MAG: ImmA/IrrE family metallo-endopeptidase [Bacteroidetes bacterium]|nr:ImmA/IrrE family metallo-endopeptidase [Bacteroidota bacterium]